MPDYSKGKIYKLTSSNSDDIYIGSTIQSLAVRKAGHKCGYLKYLDGTASNFVSSFKIFELGGDIDICLIENVNCETKEQLHSRERHYIETMKCVNKIVPTRTIKEYNEDNKEIIAKKNKEYVEKNRDKVLKYKHDYYQQNKADIILKQKQYEEDNKEKQKQYRKEYRAKNKEKIKQYRLENKEKIRETERLYQQNNKDKINAKRRELQKLKKEITI